MVARALDRQDHIAVARDQLAHFRRYVTLYGIGEYNSPNYLPHQVNPAALGLGTTRRTQPFART